MSRIRLSEKLCVEATRLKGKTVTILDILKRMFKDEGKDALKMFVRDDITEINNWENILYVEPKAYLFEDDYSWRDIKDRNRSLDIDEYATTEDLLEIFGDINKKLVLLFGDIGCGKTTFVKHFKIEFDKNIKGKKLCINVDFQGATVISENTYLMTKYDKISEIEKACYNHLIKEKQLDGYFKYVLENAQHPDLQNIQVLQSMGKHIKPYQLTKAISEWRTGNIQHALELISKYLRSINYHILIIFDNVDPLPISYQEQFTKEVLNLVYTIGIQALITVRFFSAQNIIEVGNVMGNFIPFRIMKLDLPSIPELLAKRCEYYIFEALKKDEYTFEIRGVGVTFKRKRFFELIKYINTNLLTEYLLEIFITISDMNIVFMLDNYFSSFKN